MVTFPDGSTKSIDPSSDAEIFGNFRCLLDSCECPLTTTKKDGNRFTYDFEPHDYFVDNAARRLLADLDAEEAQLSDFYNNGTLERNVEK